MGLCSLHLWLPLWSFVDVFMSLFTGSQYVFWTCWIVSLHLRGDLLFSYVICHFVMRCCCFLFFVITSYLTAWFKISQFSAVLLMRNTFTVNRKQDQSNDKIIYHECSLNNQKLNCHHYTGRRGIWLSLFNYQVGSDARDTKVKWTVWLTVITNHFTDWVNCNI